MDRVRDGFVAVGNGLAGMLEGRLYRETHASFEAFTEEEFGIQRAHAHRLVNAARQFQAIAPAAEKRGLPLPQNEAQLRPLAKLDHKEAIEVWAIAAKRAAKEKTPLTAELVAKEVYRYVTPTDEIERATDRRRDRRDVAAQAAADRKAVADIPDGSARTPVLEPTVATAEAAVRAPNPLLSDKPLKLADRLDGLEELVRLSYQDLRTADEMNCLVSCLVGLAKEFRSKAWSLIREDGHGNH